MANPIIKIKRTTTGGAPGTLSSGELAMDLLNLNLYVGDAASAPVAIGGSGLFARKDASDVAFAGGSINGVTIGATTASTGAFTTLTATNVPSAATDVVRKSDLDALGSVFHYVGDVSSASTPLDLTTLSDKNTGAYYKVDVAGAYTDGTTTFNVKVGDAFVKTTTSWQKIDNVDVVVSHEAGGEITVTGAEDTGYVVKLNTGAGSWKDGVDTDLNNLETKTQNIDLTDTTAGTTRIDGNVVFGSALGGGGENFKVASNGTVSINSATNSATWHGYGTLVVTAGGGEAATGGGSIGLRTTGALVCDNATPMAIEGFVIDGGSY